MIATVQTSTFHLVSRGNGLRLLQENSTTERLTPLIDPPSVWLRPFRWLNSCWRRKLTGWADAAKLSEIHTVISDKSAEITRNNLWWKEHCQQVAADHAAEISERDRETGRLRQLNRELQSTVDLLEMERTRLLEIAARDRERIAAETATYSRQIAENTIVASDATLKNPQRVTDFHA